MEIDVKVGDGPTRSYVVCGKAGDAILLLLKQAHEHHAVLYPPDPTKVSVILQDCGLHKIAVIKELRAYYGFNLKNAKEWAERAPVKLPPLRVESATEMEGALRLLGAVAYGSSAVDRLGDVLST